MYSRNYTYFSIAILIISAAETYYFYSPQITDGLIYGLLSMLSIIPGIIASCFVLGGQYAYCKTSMGSVSQKYKETIDSFARLVFWLGLFAGITGPLTYPFINHVEMPVCPAPMGVGFLLGAKWMYNRNMDASQENNSNDISGSEKEND